jgi:hypothetical protein
VSDAATDAWVAAVEAAFGSVSTARKALVDNLIVGLKSDGVWSKLDRLWLGAVETPQAAQIDLKALAGMTLTGSPGFNPNKGYYTFTRGGSYIEFDYNFVTNAVNFSQNSAHVSCWNLQEYNENDALLLGAVSTDVSIYGRMLFSGGHFSRINATNSTMVPIYGNTGFFLVTRSDSATQKSYRNGVLLVTDSNESGAVVNQKLRTDWGMYGAVTVGGGLTPGEQLALYSRISTYLTAVWSVSGLDSATQAWVAAVAAAGGYVSAARQVQIDNFIGGLKSDGIWSKLDRLWLFAAENIPSALTDLVVQGMATAVNSPLFNSSTGFDTTGGGSYLTPLNFADVSLFSASGAHAGVWNLTSGNMSGFLGSWQNLNYDYTDGVLSTAVIDYYASDSHTVADARGWIVGNRSSDANNRADYLNGLVLDAPYNTLAYGKQPNDLGLQHMQAAALSIGGSLNATEQLTYYNRLTSYLAAAGVPMPSIPLALEAGHPQIGAPAMTRLGHVTFASVPALAAGAPAFGTPVCALPATAIAAAALAAGHPQLGAPTVVKGAVAIAARALAVNHPFVGKPSSTAISIANTETGDWVSSVQTQSLGSVTVSQARVRLIDVLISGLKADALWTNKIDRLWILAADDTTSALTDIRNLAVAEADAPFTANQGYFCSWSGTVYTKFVPSQSGGFQTQNSAHIAIWNLTDGFQADNALDAGGTGVTFLNPWSAGEGGGVRFAINDQPANFAAISILDCRGFMLANRSSVTARQIYLNGASLGAVPGTTSTARPEEYIDAGGDRMLSVISLGPSLNSTEQSNYYKRVRTYLTEVGVQTGLLVARSLAVGEPQITFPVLSPPVTLIASTLATSSPALERPVIGLTAVAVPFVVGPPALQAGFLLQTHVLGATGFATGAPAISVPAAVGAVPIPAVSLAVAAPAVGVQTIGQTHVLGMGTLAAGRPGFSSAILTIVGVTSGYPLITGAPGLGTAVLAQTHSLATAGLAGGLPAFGVGILAQTHVLASPGLAVPSIGLAFPFAGIVGQTAAVPLIAGRPVLETSWVGLLGLVFRLTAPGLAVSSPVIGTGREAGFAPMVWLRNRLKWWQTTDPNGRYYDEDGTENGGLVQEAIFSNLNDEIELTVAELTLVGRTAGGRGPAEMITAELPLFLFEGKLSIDWSRVDGLEFGLAAEIGARQAAVAANTSAIAALDARLAALETRSYVDRGGVEIITPSTGFVYSVAATSGVVIMNSASTLAAGTFKLPTAPLGRQRIDFIFMKNITSLSFATDNGAHTLSNAPSSTSAGKCISAVFGPTLSSWMFLA